MLVDETLETAADTPVVRVASAVASEDSLDPVVVGVPYGSDASKLSRHGIDSIVFGPGSIDQAHAAVEFVPTAEVERAAAFYGRFIDRFGDGSRPASSGR
jgi:acetylornithine deacetylase